MLYVLHGLRILTAVIASGLSASLIISILFSLREPLSELFLAWIGVAAILVVFASPLLLIAIIWSEFKAIRKWWFFAVFGIVASAFWLVIFAGDDIVVEIRSGALPLMLGLLASGLVGGLTYWVIAGRRAGILR